MKLYTEEQVTGIYRDGFNNGLSHRASMEDIVINKYQPIELPSDEEIEKIAEIYYENDKIRKIIWINGVKYFKEQILTKFK